MKSSANSFPFDELPKAELHLHLEGSMQPSTVMELAGRHGQRVTAEEAAARYSYSDFNGFIQAYIWVTSFLHEPEDYALITRRLIETLLRDHVVYAELSISAGMMLWREENITENFAAISEMGASARREGLQLKYHFDVVRRFGPEPAKAVARAAADLQSQGLVAFGIGGDENSLPASDFRNVFAFVREAGLHAVAHAGEIGGPDSIRDAINILHAERIGHGIAAMHDAALCAELVQRGIAFDVCPGSNLATGALARQTSNPHATLADHPLKLLFDRGVTVTLSTDDPPMFHTNLRKEYETAAALGFTNEQLARVAENGFLAAFLPAAEKNILLDQFRQRAAALGLI